jgi:hypothetical protein
MKDQIFLIQGCPEFVVRVEAQQGSGQMVCGLLFGTSCTNGMGLASNSASSPLSVVTGDLLLGFLERFPSLIDFHNDGSCAAFNLFM